MLIAVVVPTYRAHFTLLESLLENIGQQTRPPNLVVIRASSCKVDDIPFLEDLGTRSWPFPLKILSTAAKQYAAQNRNEGSDAVPEFFDAISYLDSDDLMHPRRLEILEKMLKEGADIIAHSYKSGSREDATEWWDVGEPAFEWDPFSFKKESIYCLVKKCNVLFSRAICDTEKFCLHAAHITVRLACFKAVRFDETAFRYEDSQFMSDVLWRGYKSIALENKLTYWSLVPIEEERKKYLVVDAAT
jgi:glycosyltransferase involved in cell wall biosynthesis